MTTRSKKLNTPLFAGLFALTLTTAAPGCGNTDPGTGGPPAPPPPPNKCGSCARYESCMPSGVCGINANSTWFLSIDSATIASTKPDGSAWDAFGGAPDPFVQLDSKRTSTKQDSFTPTWQEGSTYTANNLLVQGVTVSLFDEDVSANDPIGDPTTIRPTEADLRTGLLTVRNLGQAQTLTLSFIPQ